MAKTAKTSEKTAKRKTPKKKAAAEKYGTFEELLARFPESTRKLAAAAKKQILAVHPNATEVVRLGDGIASYGLGPKKMSEAHTYVAPQADYVNIGFFHGGVLSDPDQQLEGTGARMRHVKVRSTKDVAKCRRLIEAALAERRETLGQ